MTIAGCGPELKTNKQKHGTNNKVKWGQEIFINHANKTWAGHRFRWMLLQCSYGKSGEKWGSEGQQKQEMNVPSHWCRLREDEGVLLPGQECLAAIARSRALCEAEELFHLCICRALKTTPETNIHLGIFHRPSTLAASGRASSRQWSEISAFKSQEEWSRVGGTDGRRHSTNLNSTGGAIHTATLHIHSAQRERVTFYGSHWSGIRKGKVTMRKHLKDVFWATLC